MIMNVIFLEMIENNNNITTNERLNRSFQRVRSFLPQNDILMEIGIPFGMSWPFVTSSPLVALTLAAP